MNRLLAVAFTGLLACAPLAASADPSDIAFDQLQRAYVGASPPPFGTFDELKATFAALGPSVTYPPVPGSMSPGGPGASGALSGFARQREGIFYHYSFLGKLSRVDDPNSQKTTIARPDKNEVDYLDFATKTYVAVTGEAARALLDTDVVAQFKKIVPKQEPGTGPQGTMTFALTASSKPLAAMTIEGIPTVGSAETADLGVVTATGACPKFSVTATQTYYVDPTRAERAAPQGANLDPKSLLEQLDRNGACAATVSGQVPQRSELHDHLILYSATRLEFRLPSVSPVPIAVSAVIQRAHVTPLGAGDAGLFDIPAGFTAAPASPSPSAPPEPPAPAPAAPTAPPAAAPSAAPAK